MTAYEDRLLEAAAAAFARAGAGASVKDIARQAGAGVGTLYRRFPAKALLIEAIYGREVRRLCEAAPHLAATEPPVYALRTWMERFIDFMATKHGMADALRIVLTDDSEKPHTRALLAEAIDHLLTSGDGQSVARPAVNAQDVLMALGGISLMAASEERHGLGVDVAGPYGDAMPFGVADEGRGIAQAHGPVRQDPRDQGSGGVLGSG